MLGLTELLYLNGVLAAFVAGIVFNFAGSSDAEESQERESQKAISHFFDLPIFVLLGMAIAWEVWTVGSLIICASVMDHGATATPLSKLYGRSIRDQRGS